jgi:hypothetical protein
MGLQVALVLALGMAAVAGCGVVGVALLVRALDQAAERHLAHVKALVDTIPAALEGANTTLQKTIAGAQGIVGGEPEQMAERRLALEERKLALLEERDRLELRIRGQKAENDIRLQQLVQTLKSRGNAVRIGDGEASIHDVDAA